MPTYQYSCTECGTALEAQQSFSDDPLTVCPACDGRLRKVFSAVGVVFKGSGFYRTDSRSKPTEGSDAASNGASGSKRDSEKSGDSKADSGSKKSGDATSSSTSSASSSSAKAGSAA